MHDEKTYPDIDRFRLIAALLVITIHTSPLGGVSAVGDFLLTRVIARVAVPFFFVTSGFFLLPCDAGKLGAFVKKTARIYLVAMLLYLPVNVYSGYFASSALMPKMLQDIVFDGTFYHLWYLPASMLGACIAWGARRKWGACGAVAFCTALYVLGLLGDSYYGLSARIPCIARFYDLIFQMMDYTRNGIFFAPVFFALGGLLAQMPKRLSRGKCAVGFVCALACMMGEALFLRARGWQRHDSMYLFLIPCVYFLFSLLLHGKGTCPARVRTVSLLVYILHPLGIVAVRLLAKIANAQALLVENGIVHFLTVTVGTFAVSAVLAACWARIRPEKKPGPAQDRAYLELNMDHLAHNVTVLQQEMPTDCRMMAVVKAEAYGHGLGAVADLLAQCGVSAFAVATIDEGICLRKRGIAGEILILGYTAPHRARELHKYRLTQTLIDHAYAHALDAQRIRVRAHIKIDTGMHRLGFDAEDTARVIAAFSMPNLEITGIFTHLCVADSLAQADVAFTRGQIDRFYALLDRLKAAGIALPRVHIQSSYGLLNYPELQCDYVRMGIALYGVLSAPQDRVKRMPDLKPVLSLKARVVLLRNVARGESVGYGRAFTAMRESVIAILPIGYADGYPRTLSGKGTVLIEGQKAPIVGRVCMDQLAVDVTDIPATHIGSIATLIGTDGTQTIPAPAAAQSAETITNELLSRLGKRLGLVIK